jgi:hypothetical protein
MRFSKPHPKSRPWTRPAISALVLSLSILASGSAGAQVACDAPLVTELTAGIDDNFAPPTEPASPRAELLAFLGSSPPVFDQAGTNRRFGHTFTGIPRGVVGAQLTLRLRALSGESENDGLALEFLGQSFAWNARIALVTGKPWVGGDEALLTLDLATLGLLHELGDGNLDVYVQDDTAVDFMTLVVTHCEPPQAAQDPCITPPPGLVGWWPLDETTGSTAGDIAGHHDGSYVGTPTPGFGNSDNGLSFNKPDWVEVSDPKSTEVPLDFGEGDFSISLEVCTSQVEVGSLVDKRQFLPKPVGYALYLYGGKLALQLADGGSGTGHTNYVSKINVADGSCHFIAVTVDRSEPDGIRFYFDDREVVTERRDPTTRRGSLDNDAPLKIGGQPHTSHPTSFGSYLHGTLDEIQIFNRALSAEEVKAISYAAMFFGPARCKVRIQGPRNISMCPQDASVVMHPTICNDSVEEKTFTLTFFTPPELGCLDGPDIFKPASVELKVPARGCNFASAEVARPPVFRPGDVRCFQMTASSDSHPSVTARTAVWSALPCSTPLIIPYFEVPDTGVTTLFSLRNPSAAPVTLPYEIVAGPAESGGVPVSLNDLEPGQVVTGQVAVPAGGKAEVAVDVALLEFQPFAVQEILLRDARNDAVLASAGVRSFAPGCTPGPTALCLNGGRFQVSVAWKDFAGRTGVGQAVPLTGDAGYFWFFSPANVELVLKVLDGRPLNDHFWVFSGSLSTVEYIITVTDTQTGTRRTFVNPSGHLASLADTSALPGNSPAASAGEPALAGVAEAGSDLAELAAMTSPAGTCIPSPTALCLNGGRFQVEVEWRDFEGKTGMGQAVPLTGDSGTFWFFSPENVELALKVLDGTPVNRHWWVFYGALSSVEYRITVTDTATGTVKTYFNPSGNVGSVADASAFPE